MSAGNHSTKTETFTISEQETRGCDAKQTESIHVDIMIPHFRPINTSDLHMINVKYTIRVSSTVSI